ncbi:DUF3987 domain-containing protein [Sulfitobacter dubius]|uniref:DUF3987 domain-containing protein n=1 Tax=Sulfitobacter dubius TaxID=218673 RepID=UPI0022AF64EE|nr:DUF3987 domain-containing protein [Sulfitobacter dubius]MCZ4366635.1 DUF3987 domain-containing protein [Sulfitobacter dubius]
MNKMNDILAGFDIDGAVEANEKLAAAAEVRDDEEVQSDDVLIEDQPTPAKAIVEPIDLFGDSSLTGRQEITEDMMPPAIWAYAKDTAERMGINVGPIAAGCLATVATAIRGNWRVQPKFEDDTWTEKPVIWLGITGSSGVKKTSALNSSALPLFMLEKKWAEDADELRKEYARERAAWNEEKKAWRKKCQEILKHGGERADMPPFPDEPERPFFPRLVTTDTTTEAVMKLCADNPAGIAQIADELTGWIGSFDVYSGGNGGKDRAFWLSAYNSQSAIKDRAGDDEGPLRVDTLAVTIMGGIQDDVIAKDFSKTKADGFLARFLFVKGEKRKVIDRKPDRDAIKAYVSLVGTLAAMEVAEEKGGTGLVLMGARAAKIREEIEDMTNALGEHPSVCKGLSDHLNKWPGIFSRLCLIFHLIECATEGKDPEKMHITEETARHVYRLLTEYFLPEASRIYNEVMTGDENAAHAKWIAGHILAHKKERISCHEIGRAFSPIKDDYLAIGKAAQVLELMGWITPDKRADGRPYQRSEFSLMKWRINPRVHGVFADRARIEAEQRKATVERIQAGAKVIRKLRSKVRADD